MIGAALEQLIGRQLAASPPPTEILEVHCEDGWTLPLRRLGARPGQARRGAVLLAPGLGGNHAVFELDPERSLAHALTARGFEVFVATFRGTTGAAPPAERGAAGQWDVGLDDLVRYDAAAILQAVRALNGSTPIHWVGHSLGAVAGLRLAAGQSAGSLRGVVALGAPLDLAEPALRRWLGLAQRIADLTTRGERVPLRRLGRLEAPLMGHLQLPHALAFVSPPGVDPDLTRRLHAHGVEDLPGRLLRDLARLADEPGWVDGALRALKVPVTFIAGERDPWASPAATRAALARAGIERPDLVPVGKGLGHRGDYAHVALVAGSHAPVEVFPLIVRALEGFERAPLSRRQSR